MTEPPAIPLEARRARGLVPAVGETLRLVLLAPADFFARPSRERSLLPPLALALALHAATAAATLAVELAVGVPPALAELLARLPPEHAWLGRLLSPEARLAACVLAPTGYLVGLAGRAAFWSLALLSVGGLRAPLRETTRALAYTDGVMALGPLGALPIVGGLLGFLLFLWRALLELVAMRALHGAPTWKLVVGSSIVSALLATATCCVTGALLWRALEGLRELTPAY